MLPGCHSPEDPGGVWGVSPAPAAPARAGQGQEGGDRGDTRNRYGNKSFSGVCGVVAAVMVRQRFAAILLISETR